MDKLRRIWADVLLLEPEEFQDTDNFFELGGDSVKAIQLLSEIAVFNASLDLETFYQNPTLRGICEALRLHLKGRNGISKEEDNSLKETAIRATFEKNQSVSIIKAARISPIQEFFLNLAMAGQVGLINYIYEVEGADVELGLKQLTQLLEAKHPILRTTIIEAGSNNRVQLVSGREPPWIKAPAIQAYLEATMHERMYMGCPAAQYCLVLNDPAQESKTFFVISMHHTYCDAFSRYLLEKDMLHILQSPSAFAQEEPRPWFGDFVNHLHKLGRDKDLLDYWTRYVQGTNMANIYPPELYDPRPGEIDGELSATLPARPLNEGRTQPSSTLPAAQTQFILSAWSLALAKHSRFRDIVFGLCRHGRSHLSDPNVRRMVGPLVTATPFRVRLDQAGETAVDLASRVQREIFSTAKWEQGYVPGVYPSGDGAPWVQSLVNMKSELYAMPDGYKTDEAGAPITRLITRRDIQFYDMESSWAVILIVHQKQGTFRFKMYYRSTLLEHGNAEALFGDFQEYVRKLTAYEGWTVGELIDGHVDDAA